MKKIVKKMSLAMALVTCATMSVTALPKVEVMAEPIVPGCTTTSNYLKIAGFKSKGNVNEEYVFASFALENTAPGSTVRLTLTDPYGRTVTGFDNRDITAETPADVKFTPTFAGAYVAKYVVTSATNQVSTSEFKINIGTEETNIGLEFPVNVEEIVPAKVNTKTNNQATQIKFPAPTKMVVIDEDGTILSSADLAAKGLTVTLTQPTNTLSGGEDDSSWDAATNTLTLDATRNAVYKARYEVKKYGKLVASQSIQIDAKTTYNAPDYKYSYSTSKPTTADIGVEKVLPSVNATSIADDSAVKVYYTVKASHNGEDVSETVLKTNEKGEYVFTANDEGKFVITYTIKDFSGKAPSADSTSFTISDVADRTAPVPMVTLPYAEFANNDKVDAIEGFKDVQVNADFMILPIFAKDDANGYIANNLTLYRQIVDKSTDTVVFDESKLADTTNQYANKALIFNRSAGALSNRVIYLNGQTQTITPEEQFGVVVYGDETALTIPNGDYFVKYIAKDKLSGKADVTLSLSLKIVDSISAGTVAPEVKFATATPIPASANAGDVIKFNVPTATQPTDGNFTDTHLTTYITYQLSVNTSSWTTAVRYDSVDSWITLNKEKNEYKLSIPEVGEGALDSYKYIKILANSMNDRGDNNPTEKVIHLIGLGDSAPTTVTSVDTTGCDTAKVGDQAKLPTVTYDDDLPRNVNVQVIIKDADGNAYNAQNLVYNYTGAGTVSVKDGYFVPEKVGTYDVTYISTDASSNKTVVSFAVTVGANPESFTANFENVPSAINGGKAEAGDKITLPNLTVYVSDTDYLQSEGVVMTVEGTTTYESDHETYIKFKEAGEYTVQFKSKIVYKADIDGHNAGDEFKTVETKKYTVTVTNTSGPKVLNKLDMEQAFYQINADGPIAKGTILKYPVLPLPACDNFVPADSTLTVTSSGITYETFKLDADGITRLTNTGVTVSRDGVYNFVYTLKDSDGNSTVLDVFKVEVGDVLAPELKVAEGVVSNKYTERDTIKVDMSKITADDNLDGNNLIYCDTDGKYKLKFGTLSITLKNTTTGETINSKTAYDKNNLNFEFDGLTVGEYYLNVSITDTSSQTTTNSEIKFAVSESAAAPVSSEQVLGIVLIVVSVLMLGGVVTYFVVTRKKYKY